VKQVATVQIILIVELAMTNNHAEAEKFVLKQVMSINNAITIINVKVIIVQILNVLVLMMWVKNV
jgi:hypothetical protein